ncbi:hypothetical protein TI39_contig696g00002 [Zymoseptoria brevis]|uniref:Uncharacterized protein n=1 Tax=Zymoseptoria brevis TaxID=1047168 RepID=A0A0F4GG09_9PEZI|nr:hypothetical protein TI39_contig696g00002 [Zymoseptoria brevis]
MAWDVSPSLYYKTTLDRSGSLRLFKLTRTHALHLDTNITFCSRHTEALPIQENALIMQPAQLRQRPRARATSATTVSEIQASRSSPGSRDLLNKDQSTDTDDTQSTDTDGTQSTTFNAVERWRIASAFIDADVAPLPTSPVPSNNLTSSDSQSQRGFYSMKPILRWIACLCLCVVLGVVLLWRSRPSDKPPPAHPTLNLHPTLNFHPTSNFHSEFVRTREAFKEFSSIGFNAVHELNLQRALFCAPTMPAGICDAFVAAIRDLEALFDQTGEVDTKILKTMHSDVEFIQDIHTISPVADLLPDEQRRYVDHRASWAIVASDCKAIVNSTTDTGVRLKEFQNQLDEKLDLHLLNCFPGPFGQYYDRIKTYLPGHHPKDYCSPDLVRAILALSRVVKSLPLIQDTYTSVAELYSDVRGNYMFLLSPTARDMRRSIVDAWLVAMMSVHRAVQKCVEESRK